MVTLRYHLGLLLLWVLCGCRIDPVKEVHSPIPSNLTASTKPVPADPCHLDMAATQVGTIESGTSNYGPEVRDYLASTGFKEGAPWCAAFVHWSYRSCDRVIEPPRSFALAANWHSKSHRVWEKGGWVPDTADTWQRISANGDHFALWYSNLNRIGHTGLIYKETEQFFYTIEGNTNSGGERDGDGVFRRKRLKKSVYCVSRW